MAMKITAEMLREKGACNMDWFVQEFPDGIKVTRANARTVAERFFSEDIDWAAENLLTTKSYHWYIDNLQNDSTMLQLAEAFWRASKMED